MPATKPKTKASLTERLDALIQEAASIVEEVEQNAKDALVTAEAEVWEAHRRFGSARGELVKLARQEGALREELSDLPLAHSRAVLNDDEDEVARVKARHDEVRQELDRISERRPELEETIKVTGGPNIERLPDHLKGTGVLMYQRDRVGKALDIGFGPLNKLERELASPITAALDRQKRRASEHVSVQRALNDELAHDPEMLAERQRRRAEEGARNIDTAARSR